VDQIVDQVVNPKVATIFEPKIESIVYKYLGITPPPPPPPRPTMLPAPPLPPFAGHMNGSGSSLLNVETTAGLLPTDLEQISPDSDRATVKSDLKDDELPPGVDDEDTSPSYEMVNEEKPLVSKEELNNGAQSLQILHRNSMLESEFISFVINDLSSKVKRGSCIYGKRLSKNLL